MFARPGGVLLLTLRWGATAEGSGEQTPWDASARDAMQREGRRNDERGARGPGGGAGIHGRELVRVGKKPGPRWGKPPHVHVSLCVGDDNGRLIWTGHSFLN